MLRPQLKVVVDIVRTAFYSHVEGRQTLNSKTWGCDRWALLSWQKNMMTLVVDLPL